MVYIMQHDPSNMIRTIKIVTMKKPNTYLRGKVLTAKRTIKRGELITVHPLAQEKLRRSYEERRELNRLAKVAYEHAQRSG